MQITLGDALGIRLNTIKKRPAPMRPKERRCFSALIWAITGPIIVMPGYTDMPIPDNIKARIRIERLILAARQEPMASEAETMWYISTATLCSPIGRDWSDIFMYLTRKFMLLFNEELPDFLQDQIILNEMQECDLKHLREWLFKRSIEEVKDKGQDMGKDKKLDKKSA